MIDWAHTVGCCDNEISFPLLKNHTLCLFGCLSPTDLTVLMPAEKLPPILPSLGLVRGCFSRGGDGPRWGRQLNDKRGSNQVSALNRSHCHPRSVPTFWGKAALPDRQTFERSSAISQWGVFFSCRSRSIPEVYEGKSVAPTFMALWKSLVLRFCLPRDLLATIAFF